MSRAHDRKLRKKRKWKAKRAEIRAEIRRVRELVEHGTDDGKPFVPRPVEIGKLDRITFKRWTP